MMEEEIKNEKCNIFLALCILFIQGFIIGFFVLFFVGVSKVDAAPLLRVWDNTTWVADGDGSTGIYRYPFNDSEFIYINRLVYQTDTNVFTSGHKYNIQFQLKTEHRTFEAYSPINSTILVRWQTSNNTLWDGTNITNKCNIGVVQGTTHYGSSGNISSSYQKDYRYTLSCNDLTAPSNVQRMVFEYRESDSAPPTIFFYGQVLKLVVDDTQNMTDGEMAIIDNIGAAAADITNSIDSGVNSITQNQNKNASDIMKNQDENNQKLIESNQVCKTRVLNQGTVNGVIQRSDGSITTTYNDYKTTDFIELVDHSNIRLIQKNSGGLGRIAFYNQSKSYISLVDFANVNTDSIITIPTNAKYTRITFNNNGNDKVQLYYCQNGNQALNDGLNDINGSLTDPNVNIDNLPSIDINTGPISAILTMPVELAISVLDGIDGTCSSYDLGTLFGHSLSLPCINIPGIIGQNLWTTIDIIFSGVFAFSLRRKLIDLWNALIHLRTAKIGADAL